jgi:hypothetical protein
MDNNIKPPFTEKGYLPPGILAMSWSEFCDRYGYNSRRINLLLGLMSALKLLVQSGCDAVYIGIVVLNLNSLLQTGGQS